MPFSWPCCSLMDWKRHRLQDSSTQSPTCTEGPLLTKVPLWMWQHFLCCSLYPGPVLWRMAKPAQDTAVSSQLWRGTIKEGNQGPVLKVSCVVNALCLFVPWLNSSSMAESHGVGGTTQMQTPCSVWGQEDLWDKGEHTHVCVQWEMMVNEHLVGWHIKHRYFIRHRVLWKSNQP